MRFLDAFAAAAAAIFLMADTGVGAIPLTEQAAVSTVLGAEPPLIAAEAKSILETRAVSQFTIGHGLCSIVRLGPSPPSGGSRTDMFFWPGEYDVGCVEHGKSNIYNYKADGGTTSFSARACNVNLDFKLKDGKYEFFGAGGNARWGTCQPYQGRRHSCFQLDGGNCAVSAKWRCYTEAPAGIALGVACVAAIVANS